MQINSVSAASTAAPASQVRPTSTANKAANGQNAGSGSSTAAGPSAASGATVVSGSSQSDTRASSDNSILESTTYSTNAGGKSYSATIYQANGTYTLSVPNLPGSSVTASSLYAAENALNVRIDILV